MVDAAVPAQAKRSAVKIVDAEIQLKDSPALSVCLSGVDRGYHVHTHGSLHAVVRQILQIVPLGYVQAGLQVGADQDIPESVIGRQTGEIRRSQLRAGAHNTAADPRDLAAAVVIEDRGVEVQVLAVVRPGH